MSKSIPYKEVMLEDGVNDITPKMAQAYFAKALHMERVAGYTTSEAEEVLDKAVAKATS